MQIKQFLLNSPLNLLSLFQTFTKKKVSEDLDEIIKTDYEKLISNQDYYRNFLDLVSYLYAHEQLAKQKSDQNSSIKTTIFDDEFKKRLELLRNQYAHAQSIP